MDTYKVKKADKPFHVCVSVPGSKSITNRALLMAAMSDGKTVLRGVQFSDDSANFLQALIDLGFHVDTEKERCVVTIEGTGGVIPQKEAEIYVGSAGTAARFLTAFVSMGDGIYTVTSSEQMKKRPMKELLVALEKLGAEFEWLEDEYTFPMKVYGIRYQKKDASFSEKKKIDLNIDRSSQFLSALLMTAPLVFDDVTINLTGTRSARSYVEITEQMMKQFGHAGVSQLEENCYNVKKGVYGARDYVIEPDVSAACYFYAMAAVLGGSAVVRHMKKDSLQGDMRFMKVLEQMGCISEWGTLGDLCQEQGEHKDEVSLKITGPLNGKLKGITVNMSDFSDQALTLAAIAPFADSTVTINGVAHIRGQESDRIKVMVTELSRMGIQCEELEDGVKILPGEVKSCEVETYDDHRVAMSFAVTGLRSGGIVISNPMCCKKTFADYFKILNSLV